MNLINGQENVVIRLINVSKRYGRNIVLDNINLEFKTGKCYMLLGENGSGKTTILKIILGLISCEGTVVVKSKNIGYVPDNLNFPCYVKVGDFLLNMGLIKGIKAERLQASIKILLSQWELLHCRDKRISELSKGMRQKVLIIQAMLHNPNLYIFDEALNGLDQNMQLKLLDFIKAIKDSGRTIIITSHYFAVYKSIVDEVIYLKDGKACV